MTDSNVRPYGHTSECNITRESLWRQLGIATVPKKDDGGPIGDETGCGVSVVIHTVSIYFSVGFSRPCVQSSPSIDSIVLLANR